MIKPLTSLRFFFALMVFVSHLPIAPPAYQKLNWLQLRVFEEGFIGVSFFFILSGFIISYNYADRIALKAVSFRQFWVARIARIYPLHLLTLLLALPIAFQQFWAEPLNGFAIFVSNVLLLQSFVPYQEFYFSFNMPSWSISDEFFFYLSFPFLVVYFGKHSWLKWLALLFILSVLPLIWFTPELYARPIFYINPLLRIADFMLGMMLYHLFMWSKSQKIISSTRVFTWLESASILFFVLSFLLHHQVALPFRFSVYYWPAMVGIIFIFAFQRGLFSSMLSHPFLMRLGEISFGFYMLHHLVIRYLLYINKQLPFTQNQYLLFTLMFLFALICSFLSYHFVEQPSSQGIKVWYKNQLTKA